MRKKKINGNEEANNLGLCCAHVFMQLIINNVSKIILSVQGNTFTFMITSELSGFTFSIENMKTSKY